MSNKYSDARYPEKINDLIDNEGQISEEGKKAIEEAGVEAKDPRLPELTPEDVGKMLSVDEEGNYKLVDAPSGGTKLYKHTVAVSAGVEFSFVSWKSEPIVPGSMMMGLQEDTIGYFAISGTFIPRIWVSGGQQYGALEIGATFTAYSSWSDSNPYREVTISKVEDTVVTL